MAVGPIPWTACLEYARTALEMDDREALFLWRIIHHADTAVRAHRREQEDKKKPPPGV